VTESFRSERFDPARHDVSAFACGEETLDLWLREQADAAMRRGTARTWVWVDVSGTVVAYYALAAHKVARADVPTKIGRGGPVEIPSVLLARLALARHLRGQRLGAVLIADALERIVDATQTVGARFVVVDALSERVAQLYEILGFRRVPQSLMLVQKISDIEAVLRN
jgi:GNAT superfamily N-acetyltransferase